MPKLRVGIVDYLNSKPLAWGFLHGYATDRVEPSFHPPARVADLLRAGELDVGLIPSIEVQRIPDLQVVPGLAIAATQEVRSVLLLARRPFAEVRRVALDENSRTSQALVKIVLEDGWSLHPEYVDSYADIGLMLRRADAALLIGDPALHVDRERYEVLDLAAEWRRLTGLPFVFAVWAAAPQVDADDLAELFARSLELGMAALPELLREAGAESGLPEELLREYFTQSLSYRLGPAELEGLEEFYRRAHGKGLIAAPRGLGL